MCSLRERGSHRHVCGATLFRRNWVLTAARCVDPETPHSVGLSPVVYCGIHHRKKAEEDQVAANSPWTEARRAALTQVFDAIAGYIHHKWTGNVQDGHDVAVLKLDRGTNLMLPRLVSGNVALRTRNLLAATGWGATKSGVPSKKLKVATSLALVGQDHCKEQPQGVDPSSWICAGGMQENTCKGYLGYSCLIFC